MCGDLYRHALKGKKGNEDKEDGFLDHQCDEPSAEEGYHLQKKGTLSFGAAVKDPEPVGKEGKEDGEEPGVHICKQFIDADRHIKEGIRKDAYKEGKSSKEGIEQEFFVFFIKWF